MTRPKFSGIASLLIALVMLMSSGIALRSAAAQEVHPGPRASCPICAMRIARAITAQRRGRPATSSNVSTKGVREWMTANALSIGADTEVDAALVRRKLFEYEDYSYLDEINSKGGDDFIVAQIESSPKGDGTQLYTVYTGAGDPAYIGDDMRILVRNINAQMTGRNLSTIYFVPKGLSAAKGDAFLTSARIQQRQINPRVSVEAVGRAGSTARAQDLFFSSGARMAEGSLTQPVQVQRGWLKGFYTSSMKFLRRSGEGTLDFFARRRERLDSFVANLTSRMSRDLGGSSMASLLASARRDFNRTYGFKEGELYVRYHDEFGRTQFVKVLVGSDLNAVGDE